MSVPPADPAAAPEANHGAAPAVRRALRLAALAMLLPLLGCEGTADGLPPPPFDRTPARFFFPTGIAATPDGRSLLVANSNFDRAYNGGTLLQIELAAFDRAAAEPTRRLADLPAEHVLGQGRIDSFAGPVAVNADGTAAYVTSRDRDLLMRAPLQAGNLACPQLDCTADAIRLGVQGLGDPFDLVLGELHLPGGAGPEPVIFVSHLAPSGTATTSNEAYAAVIPERLAAASLNPFSSGAYRVSLGRQGAAAIAFEPQGGQLFAGGCFLRVPGESVVACRLDVNDPLARRNILRVLLPGAGPTAPVPQFDLGPVTGGRAETLDIELSSDGSLLYVATTRPNALLVLERPQPGASAAPVVRAVIPLAQSPGQLHVLPGPAGDLVAATAIADDALLLVDPVAGRVAAQLVPVGDAPFDLTSVATPDGHRLFVSLFQGCAVAAVDVPAGAPFQARHVATLGACP